MINFSSVRWQYHRVAVVLAIALLNLGHLSHTQAQTCPYAQIRVEAAVTIDHNAVCAAAQPWFQAGFQVLVYLSDRRPASAQSWSALLRLVEAETQLRTATQNSLNPDAIAFAITLAADLPYSATITYGAQLANTPVDSPRLEAARQAMRQQLPANPTAALTTGLSQTYKLMTDVPPSAVANLPQQTMPQTAMAAEAGLLTLLLGGVLIVGGTVAGALVIWRRRQQQQQQARLAVLQSRSANLLMGCEQLLTGNSPEVTLIYQHFVEAGGLKYAPLTQQVIIWLKAARVQLDQAFQLHHQLVNTAPSANALRRSLRSWEMLYLTLIGSGDRTLSLSNEELQTLLQTQSGLTTQSVLQSPHLSLKLDFQQISPAQSDTEGVVSYLAQLRQTIERLHQAPLEAPQQLAALQQQRQVLAARLSPTLRLKVTEALQNFDQRLQQAANYLGQDLALSALEVCQQAAQASQTLTLIWQALSQHDQQQAEIRAGIAQGYRPPQLPGQQQRVHQLIEKIRFNLPQENYPEIMPVLPQLQQADQKALETTRTWQQRYQASAQTLTQLQQALIKAETQLETQAKPDWRSLQQYPDSNWQDISETMTQADEKLWQLKSNQLPQLEHSASLAQQNLTQAEQLAAEITASLKEIEQQSQQVSDRLSCIQAAEAELGASLTYSMSCIQQVKQTCTRSLLGLIPLARPDVRLDQALSLIDSARQLGQQRQFILLSIAKMTPIG
ncbi:MAG: hypothetical protein HC886_04020 [Leptolyngbyaceae cyanobacterium SM1_1_3]|nr:hypothetical protein [Leptolyngbyaceae cyanobacterium SM1_1_3]